MRYEPVPIDPGVRMVEADGRHLYTDGKSWWPSATALVGELWPYRGPPGDGSAARVGSAVHEGMARYIIDGRGATWTGPVGTAEEGSLVGQHLARLTGMAQAISVAYAVEVPMALRELGLGGTPDLVCRLDSRLTVLDWKTKSRPVEEEWVWDAHHLQAAIYARMWEELTGERPAQTCVVVSSPAGTETVVREANEGLKALYADGTMAALARVQARERPP